MKSSREKTPIAPHAVNIKAADNDYANGAEGDCIGKNSTQIHTYQHLINTTAE